MGYWRFGAYDQIPPADETDEGARPFRGYPMFRVDREGFWKRRVGLEIYLNQFTAWSGVALPDHEARFPEAAHDFWASLRPWQRFLVRATEWREYHSKAGRAARRYAKKLAEHAARVKEAPPLPFRLDESIRLDLLASIREIRTAGADD